MLNHTTYYDQRNTNNSFTQIKELKANFILAYNLVRRVKRPSNGFICHLWKLPNGTQHTTRWMNGRKKAKGMGPPTTQANSAEARSSRPGVASRAPGNKGCKNKITSNEGGAPIIVVKLLRTDTTLDLSHKARVVRESVGRRSECLYTRE